MSSCRDKSEGNFSIDAFVYVVEFVESFGQIAVLNGGLSGISVALFYEGNSMIWFVDQLRDIHNFTFGSEDFLIEPISQPMSDGALQTYLLDGVISGAVGNGNAHTNSQVVQEFIHWTGSSGNGGAFLIGQ